MTLRRVGRGGRQRPTKPDEAKSRVIEALGSEGAPSVEDQVAPHGPFERRDVQRIELRPFRGEDHRVGPVRRVVRVTGHPDFTEIAG